MAAESRREAASLKQLLLEKTGRFDFLQAVRLLRKIWPERVPVGGDSDPRDEVVGVYRHEWAYSSEKACAELGYTITPLREGIRNTVEWLQEIGELQEVP